MNNVISLDSFRFPWREVLTIDSESSCLQVYVNDRTGEAEVVQTNDDNEVIRSYLSVDQVVQLLAVLSQKKGKASS